MGDEIELKFYYSPELNDRAIVRPDGKVAVGLIQDVPAAGRTPEQLAAEVRRRLEPQIKHADVVVSVRSFASQRVFVGGEVARPGPITMIGRLSVLQGLTEVGWMRETARRDEVVLVRRDEGGGRKIFALNLEKALQGEDMSQDVILRAGDMVFVPPSGIIEFDRWVDQHIRQALFFGTSAGFAATYDIGGVGGTTTITH